jgi:rod shape-determining protein MreC
MTPTNRSRLVIIFGSAAALLFFLHLLGVLTTAEAATSRLLFGIERGLSNTAVSVRDGFAAQFQAGKLQAENDSLKREQGALLTQVAGLESLRDENATLREALKFTKRSAKAPVMAHVLASEPDSGLHAILIDKGTDDGLAVDQPVIIGDGILIGKVLKAEKATATVMLLTDTRSRVGASIQNSGRTQGIVQGKSGLSLEMGLIPQNEDIHPGDLVVTSGIEPLVPRGLVIGQVQDVSTQERNPFKTATVVSPADFERLGIVAAIVP